MSKIQIICSKPGIRRNGVEHPAQAVYDAGHWTEEQLSAFRSDPAFIVQEAAGSAVSSDDILAAVDARVEIERQKLQDTFNQAVADAVAEKIGNAVTEKLADAKAEHDNAMDALGKKLKAAEDEVATLKAAQNASPTSDQQSGTEAGGAGEANADAGKGKPKK